jgi:ABC-2 type transport system permease protein
MTPVLAVGYREYRIRLRNPILPLWDVVVPVVYLLVFGASLERFVGGIAEGADYATFFLASVLSMVTFSIAMNSSYSFFEDLQSGIFHELLACPFPRRDLLLGKFFFNSIFSLLSSAICVLAAVLLLDVRLAASGLPGLVLWVLVGTAAWYFLFTLLALHVRGFNAYHTTTSSMYLVLMFVSNLFYPVSGLPAGLRWVAQFNPVTWQTDLLRHYTYGARSSSLQLEAVALVAFVAVNFWLANRKLNGPIE